jgi:hypothetical protein
MHDPDLLIFIDLDGVLANFVDSARGVHGLSTPWEKCTWDFYQREGLTDDTFWNPLGTLFWSSLPRTDEFDAVLAAARNLADEKNIFILSSPCGTPGCITGKAAWIERNLPEFTKRVIFTSNKHIFSGPGRLLIDDHDKNVEQWVAAGGAAVLFPRPWNKTGCTDRNVSSVVETLLQETYNSMSQLDAAGTPEFKQHVRQSTR